MRASSHRFIRNIAPLITLAATLVSAVLPGPARAADAFYAIPPGEIPGPAGTLLRAEPVPAPPGASAAYRIVYRSRGAGGVPIAVSGVVALPRGIDGGEGRPVISWGHGTTGIAPDCGPSLAPALAFQRIDGLPSLLAEGFVVVATDYQGLGEGSGHPYLAGRSEARAMIDAVRAARQVPNSRAGTRFAAWGFSQGGHASLFAGALARRYAPDLQLVGVAAASAPTELRRLLRADIGTPAGKVIVSYAAASWSSTYHLPVGAIIKPQALPTERAIASTCSLNVGDDITLGLETGGYAATGLLEARAIHEPQWSRLIARNSRPIPSGVPVFLAQGTMDDVVEPAPTRDYVEELCRKGLKVDYVEEPWASHGAAARESTGAAVSWLAARFAGQPADDDCAAILSGSRFGNPSIAEKGLSAPR